jgi:ribosomal protein S18 acetylase RimI-like enzyme
MEVDLRWIDSAPTLPVEFVWVPWDESTLLDHADVKFRCFQGELDARIFPNLATHDGCVQLMELIRAKPGFMPAATWLIADSYGCCATVQGVRDEGAVGGIQNLGVLPSHRGCGLGRALLLKALREFRLAGLKRARLEVSARNRRAVRLYHDVGFIATATLYRELIAQPEVQYSI